MNKSLVTITGLGAIIALGWTVFSASPQTATAQTRTDDAVAGQVLYQENCASCHGVNLEGEPDWRSTKADGLLPAPPHDETGHTWHHGEGLLFNYTKFGGQEALAQQGVDFNSGMPGFAEQLSDQQIWDILTYIKSTWPDRQQDLQAARTEAEILQKEANQ